MYIHTVGMSPFVGPTVPEIQPPLRCCTIAFSVQEEYSGERAPEKGLLLPHRLVGGPLWGQQAGGLDLPPESFQTAIVRTAMATNHATRSPTKDDVAFKSREHVGARPPICRTSTALGGVASQGATSKREEERYTFVDG